MNFTLRTVSVIYKYSLHFGLKSEKPEKLNEIMDHQL